MLHVAQSRWHCPLAGGSIPVEGRGGSCIVDLTQPRQYRILREGSEAAYCATIACLKAHRMGAAPALEQGPFR